MSEAAISEANDTVRYLLKRGATTYATAIRCKMDRDALRYLKNGDLVRARLVSIEGRKRKVYYVTAIGMQALEKANG